MRTAAALLAALLLCAVSYGAQEETTAITVYNDDLGLVRQSRPITLARGRSTVDFVDVASQIDPTSVHLKSLTDPDGLTVLEQNYEYDLVSTEKILRKYVDQPVQILAKGDKLHEGKLLGFSGDGVVLESGDGRITTLRSDVVENVVFPKLPEGLITRPTLVWLLECAQGGEHQIEIEYLTAGINWHAEYVAVVDRDEAAMELGAWVSLDNRSGATYRDARLKLVAGAVHRVEEAPQFTRLSKALGPEAEALGFEEEAFFEYHLYTLPRPTTLKDNQIKQLALFPAARVQVTKSYHYDGARHGKQVKVTLRFVNSREAGLGLALPAGKVRTYKEDRDRSLQFIGEDRLEHTPKDEEVRLTLGDAFDVVGERRVTEHRQIAGRTWEDEIEVKLRNHKEEALTVVVTEHLWGDWSIRANTHPFLKKDARTVEFTVPVPREEEATLHYTVRQTR